MEKTAEIKNGDTVIYKGRTGVIYGKPWNSKYKGLLFTVKIGDDYYKATQNEIQKSPEPDLK